MRQNRVQEEWLSFRNKVIPANATSVQLQEMRRAFYAGVEMLLARLIRGMSDGPDSKPEDETMLAEMQEELADFAKSVLEGRA